MLKLMHLRDLIICEGAAMTRAKPRDALCLVRFLLKQMSAPALKNCAKIMKEGREPKPTLFLEAVVSIH